MSWDFASEVIMICGVYSWVSRAFIACSIPFGAGSDSCVRVSVCVCGLEEDRVMSV